MADYAIVRFRNASGVDVNVALKWARNHAFTASMIPENGRHFWWIQTSQQFWDDFAAEGTSCQINVVGGGGVGPVRPVPHVAIVDNADHPPTWDTPSTVTGRIDVNVINDLFSPLGEESIA